MAFRDQAEREWLSWRQVCKQLKKLGIDINKPEVQPLALAIKLWGEELAALVEQNPGDESDRARAETRDKYAPHVIDGWEP